MRTGLITAIAAAVVASALGVLAACRGSGVATPEWQRAQARRNEITALWTQIRDWRREARMEVEPAPGAVVAMSRQTVRNAAGACPTQPRAARCTEICDLADAICENADAICDIAAQLGDDPWAKDKCDSAKASCGEAKQRCCACAAEGAEKE